MSKNHYAFITSILSKLLQDPNWLKTGQLSDHLISNLGHKEKELNKLFLIWANIDLHTFRQVISPPYLKNKLQKSNSKTPTSTSLFPSKSTAPQQYLIPIKPILINHQRKSLNSSSSTNIHYGMHNSPFGEYILATNDLGQICNLHFLAENKKNLSNITQHIQQYWDNPTMLSDTPIINSAISKINSILKHNTIPKEPLEIILTGTAFQLKVWRTLLFIPQSTLTTYGDLAQKMGLPKNTARAVGTAVGKNEIAYLIPCHRVLPSTGLAGHYRWGRIRKVQMIAWDATR